MANLELDKSHERTAAGKGAGDDYIASLETFRNDLDNDADTGTTLGKMVETQIKMTEEETKYQVRSGIPTKASKKVKEGADEVKQNAR